MPYPEAKHGFEPGSLAATRHGDRRPRYLRKLVDLSFHFLGHADEGAASVFKSSLAIPRQQCDGQSSAIDFKSEQVTTLSVQHFVFSHTLDGPLL